MNNSDNNKIMSGFVWKFSERFMSQGISFLVSLVLARLLTPDDYGLISLVLTFMYLADVFVVSGFNAALIQKRDATSEDFSTLFYCSFACSIIIYAVLYFTAPLIASFYNKPILVLILRVFALRIPLSAYNSIQTAYVARHMLFQRLFYSSIAGSVFAAIVGIAMAYKGCGVWALVAQYMVNMLVNTVVLHFTIPWHLERKFSKKSAKSLMSFGWKVLAADFMGTLFNNLRSLIIGRIYKPSDLAYYDKGQQLPTLISDNISVSIISVLFPAIANICDEEDKVREMTRRASQIMAYIIYPIMFGLLAVAPSLVMTLFGDQWGACVPFLQLLSISSAFGIMGNISLQVIKAIGRSDVVLKIELWKKPLFLVLLLVGVRISVLATAVTMVIYSAYATFVNMWQMKKYIHYGILRQIFDLLPVGLLSISMAIIVILVGRIDMSAPLLLVLQVFVGVIFYIMFSVIFHLSAFTSLLDFLKDMMSKRRTN